MPAVIDDTPVLSELRPVEIDEAAVELEVDSDDMPVESEDVAVELEVESDDTPVLNELMPVEVDVESENSCEPLIASRLVAVTAPGARLVRT